MTGRVADNKETGKVHFTRRQLVKAALPAAFTGPGMLLNVTRLAAAEASAFPVQVRHALGTVTIERKPERIVALGWNGEDIALALGAVPIAMPKRKYFDSGIFPWNEPFLHGARPYLLNDEVIDYEEIALLGPDLILAVSSGVRDTEYQRLSAIAPTILYRSGPWIADWREQTELVGDALGCSTQAMALIADVERLLATEVRKYPEIGDKTFSFVNYSPPSTNVFVYLPEDPKVRSLLDAGLRLAPGAMAIANDNPALTGKAISIEKVNTLKADVIIMASSSKGQDLQGSPILKSLNSPILILDDPALKWATSALSVLSIRHTYPRFISMIAQAIEAHTKAR